jgi:hypothetical protein
MFLWDWLTGMLNYLGEFDYTLVIVYIIIRLISLFFCLVVRNGWKFMCDEC